MAAELARYGVAVRIVDKAAQRTDKSKALVLWSRTLQLLDRASASAAFITAEQKVNAANIIAGNKQIGHVSLAGVDSPYPFALMLPQAQTERLPVGAGAVPRFALFAPADQAVERLLRDYCDLLEPTVRAPPRSGGMWLVRPEGYTACVAKDGDVRAIADYLQRLAASTVRPPRVQSPSLPCHDSSRGLEP